MYENLIKNIENFKKSINEKMEKLEKLFNFNFENEKQELEIYKKVTQEQLLKKINEIKDKFDEKMKIKLKKFENNFNELSEKIHQNFTLIESIKDLSQKIIENNKNTDRKIKELEAKIEKLEETISQFSELLEE